MNHPEALISLRPRHALNVLAGRKTVELRRRPARISSGMRLWIYVTLPRGHIDGVATVLDIACGAPEYIWRHYKSALCLTRVEFMEYVDGMQKVFAISIGNVSGLSRPLSLHRLRTAKADFHPPQFLQWVAPESPLHALLMEAS